MPIFISGRIFFIAKEQSQMTTKDGKIRIGVIFGGRSGEHDVSLVSAASIMKALDKNKYEIIPIGVTRTGVWLTDVTTEMMEKYSKTKDKAALKGARKVVFNSDTENRGLIALNENGKNELIKLDVVFPINHGTYGEDGTLQGMLDQADMPYVGCGVIASAAGMDKTIAKKLFKDSGLAIAPYVEILRCDWRCEPDSCTKLMEKEIGYPCFVKPVNSGSSVGITKAHNKDEFKKAMNEACKYDRKILIEKAINAREIEVSVMGNDHPKASLPGEIVPCNEFYDYSAKYIDDKSKLEIPAKLPDDLIAKIRESAVKAYKSLDGAGLARVDFFVEKETNNIIINEINTLPGFTSISMYPKLWEATGLPYSQLLDQLIELAMERYKDKQESLASVA